MTAVEQDATFNAHTFELVVDSNSHFRIGGVLPLELFQQNFESSESLFVEVLQRRHGDTPNFKPADRKTPSGNAMCAAIYFRKSTEPNGVADEQKSSALIAHAAAWSAARLVRVLDMWRATRFRD